MIAARRKAVSSLRPSGSPRSRLLVGALVALLFWLAGAAATPNTNAAATGGGAPGDVSPETWMHDLAGHLANRKLSEIVIPGSHDTATYGLDGLDWSWAGAQNQGETIQNALNQGIRMFDIRVRYADFGGQAGADYWGFHNNSISTRLRFHQILDQVRDWTLAPGNESEIILLGLSIRQDSPFFAGGGVNGPFPIDTCNAFADALGSALLTPNQLEASFGTRDPGQVKLAQLWSMPGQPRVLVSDTDCLPDDAGEWSPNPPFGSGGSTSYYANQCYAGEYFPGYPGIATMVLQAAEDRSTSIDDPNGGREILGPPMVGGIWTLFIQATTTFSCAAELKGFDLPATQQVLDILYNKWSLADPGDPMKANVNVVAGDFVEETDLVKDVIAMNASWPVVGDALTRLGPAQATIVAGDAFPAGSFAVSVTSQGNPLPYAEVTYEISPSHRTAPAWSARAQRRSSPAAAGSRASRTTT